MESTERKKRFIYMDYAATTPMLPEAADIMSSHLKNEYGNPSAVYSIATKAKEALNSARRTIASTLGAEMDTIYFTSGGTESDNWAIRGAAAAMKKKTGGNHIITSGIEHPAVLNTCRYLEECGYRITYLSVDSEGFIDLGELKRALTSETILVSVMTANNEIGTIEPIKEAAELAHSKGALFHTDAVQAYLHIPLDVKALGVDLLSASGHKFGGPKGTGFLYIRRGLEIDNLIFGGGQERNHRAGTENTAGIIGMAKAAEISFNDMKRNDAYVSELTSYMLNRLVKALSPDGTPGRISLNGTADKIRRLPNNLNICFKGINGESILIMLDMAGIAASAGSACSSGSVEPSHVLQRIGLSKADAESSVRFTLGPLNTKDDVEFVVNELDKITKKLS